VTVSKWFIASVLLSWEAIAHAHPHLNASIPAEGSSGKAPEAIVLTFSEAARITAMSLQREGEASAKLAPLPAAAAARITVPLPRLSPGKYTLSWRMVGDDGHVTSGALHFTVVTPAVTGASGGTLDRGR
jgi:methionine-rich copper-binding protein CopC